MRKFLLILTLLAGATPAYAQLGSVPYAFSSGTAISSSQVNANFSTAYSTALNRTGGTMTGSLTTLSLLPTTTATYDLGVTGTRYRDAWLSRDLAVGRNLAVIGSYTGTGQLADTVSTSGDYVGVLVNSHASGFGLHIQAASGSNPSLVVSDVTGGTILFEVLGSGTVTTATNLSVGTSLGVSTSATVGTTLSTGGAATLNSAVITNGATIGTTLAVSGASTFSGAITATSQTVTAGGFVGTTGAISTTLSAGSFSAGSAAVSGATTLGTNTTSGLTTLNGGLTANSGINVTAGTIVLQTTVNMTAASGDGIDMDIVGAKAIQFARGGVVSGNITMSGGVTTYGTTSDRRLKNDLGPTRTGLETLMALQVRDYTMKSDFRAVRHTGFMAQQVLPLVPDAVTVPYTPQDYYEMDYGRLTPLLVKSIQDQQQQMELLKQDIINLQMEVARLRAVR